MASTLIAELHGDALRLLSDFAGTHFEGLSSAARRLRLSSRSARRCRELDAAFGLSRHITKASCAAFLAAAAEELPANLSKTQEPADTDGKLVNSKHDIEEPRNSMSAEGPFPTSIGQTTQKSLKDPEIIEPSNLVETFETYLTNWSAHFDTSIASFVEDIAFADMPDLIAVPKGALTSNLSHWLPSHQGLNRALSASWIPSISLSRDRAALFRF